VAKKIDTSKCPYCGARLTNRAEHYARECPDVPDAQREWGIARLQFGTFKYEAKKRKKVLLTMPVLGDKPRRGGPPILQGGFCDGRKT
jgi:hypothetical protein